MNNTVKICFLLFSLVILSVEICESEITYRYAQSSVLVDKRIYFFGGDTTTRILDQIIYLDLSKPFDTANPPFKEILNVSIPFGSVYGTTLLDPQKKIIYLFGGFMVDVNTGKDNFNNFNSSLHTFNLETYEWNIPKTNGIEPQRRGGINGVISDETGKFYILGGQNTEPQKTDYFGDMNIFDTISLTWSKGSTIKAPLPRIDYTATLLSNGIIVYIGGRELYSINDPLDLHDVDMNQLSLYDTKDDIWLPMTARGDRITNRNTHSAILTPDERIIIFGGEKGLGEGSFQEQLAVLNTKTSPYEWSIPQVSAKFPPPTLILHSATLVGNYMFINFGNNTYPLDIKLVNIPFFYILDIRNFTWVTRFEPEQSTNTQTNSPANSNSIIANDEPDNGKKIVMIVGVVIGIVGVSATVFLGYKFYKKRKDNRAIPTAGTHF